MAFVRSFNGNIRQWNESRSDVAVVAQLAWISGRLDYPFDTAALERDLEVSEEYGLLSPAAALRYLLRHVPGLTRVNISEEPLERQLDSAWVYDFFVHRKSVSQTIAERYVAGDVYKRYQQELRGMLELQRQHPGRVRSIVTPNVGAATLGQLVNGAVVSCVWAEGPPNHTVLVQRHSPLDDPRNVTIYDPARGLYDCRFGDRNMPDIQLSGATAYSL